jgi:hypothetical protein
MPVRLSFTLPAVAIWNLVAAFGPSPDRDEREGVGEALLGKVLARWRSRRGPPPA